ncbi:MAG: IS110 family transposase [Acidobacteriota bacterium]|nr:IS110 family transposase [Acidobacteriota bacterium]
MHYVGIDHHRQYSHMTMMDKEGQVLRSARVPNLRAEIEKFLEGGEALEAVIETGRSSYTMVDVLEQIGVSVKIAHPNEVKAIARAKIKTDKRDSEVLAHLLRMNMIPEVYRRSPENRQAQRVLRQRAFYVRTMTALKNRVYAFLAQQKEEVRGEVARETNIFSAKGQKVLLGLDLDRGEMRLLLALLKTHRHLETKIAESTALVEKLYEEIREAQLIRTIPGFGKYLSVLVAVEIADLNRFSDAAHLHAYAGVIPSIHSSGDKTYHGKIIRAGNRWLRWAAVEAVWPAIRADFDLRGFYERLCRRKGANKAKVATARRLLTIIYKVWKEQRNYIPYRR